MGQSVEDYIVPRDKGRRELREGKAGRTKEKIWIEPKVRIAEDKD